jgi:sugar phosphate isomerase/epimerase
MVSSAATICLVPEAAAGPFVFHGDAAAACVTAARLGFDAVEVFAPDAAAVNALGLAKLLGDNSLSLAALGTGAGFLRRQLTLTSPSAAVRAEAIDFVRAMLHEAAALNTPVIVGSMQGRWSSEVPHDRAVGDLAEALVTLGDEAAAVGVTLLYEPLNRYETNLFTTLEATAAFVGTLRQPAVKILADLFHMSIEERDIAAGLRAAGPQVGHVHFADSNRRAAGYGHTDFAPIAAALRDIGYAGTLSAEVLPWPDAETAAAQTMTAFRQHFPRPVS